MQKAGNRSPMVQCAYGQRNNGTWPRVQDSTSDLESDGSEYGEVSSFEDSKMADVTNWQRTVSFEAYLYYS